MPGLPERGVTALVTGAGCGIGIGIIQSLRELPFVRRIVGTDYVVPAPGFQWCAATRLLPDPLRDPSRLPAWTAAVAELCRTEAVDIVFIGTDFEPAWFAAALPELTAGCAARFVVAAADRVDLAADKWLTHCFLTEHGFSGPRTVLPADADRLLAQTGYPVIVKPRRGTGARDICHCADERMLAAALARVRDPLVQECLPAAPEYTSGAVVIDGELVSMITLRRELRAGATWRAWCEPVPELDAALRPVVLALGADGPVNAQFVAVDGRPLIFEFNLRFSGSNHIRTVFGVNEPELIIRRLCGGERLPERTALRHGVVQRYVEEYYLPMEDSPP